MKNDDKNRILDKDILEMLAMSHEPAEMDDNLVYKMKDNLMQKISQSKEVNSFETVMHSNSEGWIEAFPGASFKVLKGNPNIPNSLLSYLVRLEPGFKTEGHVHPLDEETLMLEGDLTLGGKTFNAGDYHFAAAGTSHNNVSSRNGCTAFMRGALPV